MSNAKTKTKTKTMTIKLKRYAPFVGARGHGKTMTFQITVPASRFAEARRMFAERGCLIAV